MTKYTLNTIYRRLLADTTTPVSIYLRMRDVFPNSLLLESSDYHSRENNMSYICCDPIAGIRLHDGYLETHYPDGSRHRTPEAEINLRQEVAAFRRAFAYTEEQFRFLSNGLFGYFTFDTVAHFEDIELAGEADTRRAIPSMQYHVYRYVIAIDHFRNELYMFEHRLEGDGTSELDKLQYLIQNKNFPEYSFALAGEESSNMADEDFLKLVDSMKKHIYRGDVFQIVPSRAFARAFTGDEFNVYRALRSINPSPYLFYFDYGDFKLFGSSPEAQLTIRNREATIYPIAGTFKRTGDDERDRQIAEALKADPKENAEHVMLVDLARNDLSRHCEDVHVKTYKEAQYYSHVIHLVSRVVGTLRDKDRSFDVVGDTFPAGTLSGAPKHKAIQLIDHYEDYSRGFYSGAIGFMGFGGDFNHAIMIRSFLSKSNMLHYQAGAGIVAESEPEKELQEVNNKVAALRKAMEMAENI